MLAAAAIAAAALLGAVAVCSQGGVTPAAAAAEAKPVVRDRAGYHLVIEEYPGGSTWRQFDDGRVEYIIEGGN